MIRRAFRSHPRPRQGFLTRLANDQRGNALALMTAAFIPLAGMVGGAVDFGRAYLIKTRLQQACDAGALAARRMMTTSDLSTATENAAKKYFEVNLHTGAYGSTGRTFDLYTVLDGGGVSTGTVRGEASITVPTTLLRIFGKANFVLEAECDADLNIANNDILFVLDVTGSMACLTSDNETDCDTYAATNIVQSGSRFETTEKANSRIDGLRDAVKAFYATVLASTSPTARLRIGFLPYSSGVNVAGILPGGTLASTYDGYQSRVANYTTPKHLPTTTWGTWGSAQTFSSAIDSGDCSRYANNTSYTYNTANSSSKPRPAGNPPPPSTQTTGGSTPSNVTTVNYRFASWTPTTGSLGTCVRQRRTATTSYTTRYGFTNWTYQPVTTYTGVDAATLSVVSNPTAGRTNSSGSYNVQQLATMVNAGTASGMTVSSITADGCVLERVDGTSSIDQAADTNNRRWPRSWHQVAYTRASASNATNGNDDVWPNRRASGASYVDYSNGYLPNYSCPKAALLPAVTNQAGVDGYVDATDFVAHGGTYHDIGMIWGTRIMSTTGIFSAIHGPAPNGEEVMRHIIFMTDGSMKPNDAYYSNLGIEKLEKRIVGNGNDSAATPLANQHNARFTAACTAARTQHNIRVWVVAFAQALTTELTNCANAGQAFQANSTAELQTQFQTIAQRIAELRLSR